MAKWSHWLMKRTGGCYNKLVVAIFRTGSGVKGKLEDLKVQRRSPDLFNNVKIGQSQLQRIIKHILVYHIWGVQPFWSSDLKQSNEYSIKKPVISEKPIGMWQSK